MIHTFTIETFPGSKVSTNSVPKHLRITPQINNRADLPTRPTYTLTPTLPIVGLSNHLRHSDAQTHMNQCRNINLLHIDYASRPRLSLRLTQRGRACRWNP
jgi:hypothetical protein